MQLDLLLSRLVRVLVGRALVDNMHLEFDRVALLAHLIGNLVLLLFLLFRLGLRGFRVGFLACGLRVKLDFLLFLLFRELKENLVGFELWFVVYENTGKL